MGKSYSDDLLIVTKDLIKARSVCDLIVCIPGYDRKPQLETYLDMGSSRYRRCNERHVDYLRRLADASEHESLYYMSSLKKGERVELYSQKIISDSRGKKYSAQVPETSCYSPKGKLCELPPISSLKGHEHCLPDYL